MSSEIKKRKYQEPEEPQKKLNLKPLIISFSIFLERGEEFIYNGEERMLFSERHPVYRSLFLSEFATYLKK